MTTTSTSETDWQTTFWLERYIVTTTTLKPPIIPITLTLACLRFRLNLGPNRCDQELDGKANPRAYGHGRRGCH